MIMVYGISGWMNQSRRFIRQFANLKFYHLGNGAQTAMLYPYYYAKMFYEGLKNEGEDKVISLIRAAYPGIQNMGQQCGTEISSQHLKL